METNASTSQNRHGQQSATMHAITGTNTHSKRGAQLGLASLLLLALLYQACQMFIH